MSPPLPTLYAGICRCVPLGIAITACTGFSRLCTTPNSPKLPNFPKANANIEKKHRICQGNMRKGEKNDGLATSVSNYMQAEITTSIAF